jgi:hypothetical protein
MRSFEVADFGMSYAGLIHTAKQLAGMLNRRRFEVRHVIDWLREQRR